MLCGRSSKHLLSPCQVGLIGNLKEPEALASERANATWTRPGALIRALIRLSPICVAPRGGSILAPPGAPHSLVHPTGLPSPRLLLLSCTQVNMLSGMLYVGAGRGGAAGGAGSRAGRCFLSVQLEFYGAGFGVRGGRLRWGRL